jgi:threonine dehydrogenase-like Zn-dependent dehydrogenase
MRALVLGHSGTLTLREANDPVLTAADEILIRVRATGICGTDIHIVSGAYPAKRPLILGHESTGEVVRTGPAVSRFQVGDRVILDPTYFCGQCFYCLNDRPNYCSKKASTETGVSRDGTFAELHVARESFVHALPKELSFAEGTLSEPLACALHALRQTRLRTESRVLVVGLGPMGLLFSLATQAMGCEVVAGDITSYRIAQAQLLGITAHNIDGEALRALAPSCGDRFDIVIDTSGCMLEKLLPKVDRGGDLLLVGLNYRYEACISPSYLTDHGIRLIGSIDTNRTFSPAIEMLRRIPAMRRIVTHCLDLQEFEVGFSMLGVSLDPPQRCREPVANKVVLQP